MEWPTNFRVKSRKVERCEEKPHQVYHVVVYKNVIVVTKKMNMSKQN
jgi:hypothetical protein